MRGVSTSQHAEEPADDVPGERAPAPPVRRERAPDDSDVGWGERPDERDEDRRYLEDRPPHWGSD
ncbi:hypothetical protein ASG41_05660 [Modestobacter sp. Leaf380]|nr:hypothetical protein ASG41_05660 [Modestobacter sp. Leaf380]